MMAASTAVTVEYCIHAAIFRSMNAAFYSMITVSAAVKASAAIW